MHSCTYFRYHGQYLFTKNKNTQVTTEHSPFQSILLTFILFPFQEMENFNSKDFAMKAQKKILSNMANKSVMQMFIDDTSSEILDELYRVSKQYTGNRTEAQKVIKDLVKIVVKIAVLFKHNRFSEDELRLAQTFKKKLHMGAMTVISFHEVKPTYSETKMFQRSYTLYHNCNQNFTTVKRASPLHYLNLLNDRATWTKWEQNRIQWA